MQDSIRFTKGTRALRTQHGPSATFRCWILARHSGECSASSLVTTAKVVGSLSPTALHSVRTAQSLRLPCRNLSGSFPFRLRSLRDTQVYVEVRDRSGESVTSRLDYTSVSAASPSTRRSPPHRCKSDYKEFNAIEADLSHFSVDRPSLLCRS